MFEVGDMVRVWWLPDHYTETMRWPFSKIGKIKSEIGTLSTGDFFDLGYRIRMRGTINIKNPDLWISGGKTPLNAV